MHLSQDEETAVSVGKCHGRPVVYIIQSEKMYNARYKFYLAENGVWLTKEVPFAYIEKNR